MIHFIYRATCKVTGKCYVGKTQIGGKRKRNHFYDVKNGSAFVFHNALRKYDDEDLWEWDIIGITTDGYKLCDMEIDAIEREGSFINGYNMTKGGEGAPGRRVSEEARRKMRDAKKGKVLSEEHKAKLRGRTPWNKGMKPGNTKGRTAPNKGKHHTEATKAKMRATQLLRWKKRKE